MNLRCKDGDIAIISWDYPECLENLGRMVEVRGPVRGIEGELQWRIQPVTPELYAVLETDRTLTRECVIWGSGVSHPDAWMIPIRPKADPESESIRRSEPRAHAEPVSARETAVSTEGWSQSRHTGLV